MKIGDKFEFQLTNIYKSKYPAEMVTNNLLVFNMSLKTNGRTYGVAHFKTAATVTNGKAFGSKKQAVAYAEKLEELMDFSFAEQSQMWVKNDHKKAKENTEIAYKFAMSV